MSALVWLCPAVGLAWSDLGSLDDIYDPRLPQGVHTLDGSYVVSTGQLQVNITNFGLIGSRFSEPSTFSHAPSAQWPAGSGDEYLWAAGLWIGARRLGRVAVTTGQPEAELRPGPEIEQTIYEAVDAELLRPTFGPGGVGGIRRFEEGADDDNDGRVDEELLNGIDDDGDGLIDEDFGQIGNQMMVCSMRDDWPLARELYPDHLPLNVSVEQAVYAWYLTDTEDFIALEYTIRNTGVTTLEDVYLGFYVDCDIGGRYSFAPGQDDLAGYFSGVVPDRDGAYQRVALGYMRDAADANRLPGWFGVALLDHTVDVIDDSRTPMRVGMRAFRHFSSDRPFDVGGDPGNDQERYQALSSRRFSPPPDPQRPRDMRFLISSGPFTRLEPGESVEYRLALIVGGSLEELLEVACEASRVYAGHWYDADANVRTGTGCREFKVCAEDFGNLWNSPSNALYLRNSYRFNEACRPPLSLPDIKPDDLFVDEDGRHCTYVNADACEEIMRSAGREILGYDVRGSAKDGDELAPADLIALMEKADKANTCTGSGGRETNLPWAVSGVPPPSPAMRAWGRQGRVHVYWDDRSEHVPDPETGVLDFEAYCIWRSDDWDRPRGSSVETGPSGTSWSMVGRYDLVNRYRILLPQPQGPPDERFLDFGPNTGLDTVVYRPACLDDPRFAGLAEEMTEFVLADVDGVIKAFPSVRDGQAMVRPGMEPFVGWEAYPDVLDTFFQVTERPAEPDGAVVPKRAVRFYEHIDHEVHDGFIHFYSVTAADHLTARSGTERVITGEGYIGSPQTSFTHVEPGYEALDAEAWAAREEKVFVYPNPATTAALAEFQQMEPNEQDPTGVRVAFANLPAARCTIRIFTLAGDHVATIDHDGRDGRGQAQWNLVSRRGQQVVSGIYLFTVESDDPAFETDVGKFVIRW
ncbi:MAG: hypothetical protein R6X25_15570 [Candidatus Krumholzibacteriia bacterium]